MVFASYNSASYLLPLDNDQSMSFYRNENRLFPTAIGPSASGVAPPPGRNSSTTSANDMSITDMLTAAYHHEMQQQHPTGGGSGGGASAGNINAGDCPFGRVQSPAAQQQHQSHQQQPLPPVQHRFGGTVAMCDDFQPVGYFNGSSNGYYGFVPSLAATGGGVGTAGHSSNNNGLPGVAAAVNNNRHLPATTANVNGHQSAIDFHGNRHHISCNDAGEQNNNNNNNNDVGGDLIGMFPVESYRMQQKVLKRKECNPAQQHDDDEMDTNVQLAAVGQQYPKRRKTDTDQNGELAFPVTASRQFAGSHSGASYQPNVEIHELAVDAMECQDQPTQQHPAVTLQPTPNGFHSVDVHQPTGQQATSKKEGRTVEQLHRC